MRVECIKDFEAQRLRRPYKDEIFPVFGQIYTVRDIKSAIGGGDRKFYLLEEIINAPRQYNNAFGEPAFESTGFRPVTDISALTKLTKVRELEDA